MGRFTDDDHDFEMDLGGGQRPFGRHMQKRVVQVVGGGDLVQMRLGDLGRGHLLGGDAGAQGRGVLADQAHSASPRMRGTANRPSSARGAAASASSCVRPGTTVSGRVTLRTLDCPSTFDADDVDGLDLADVGQDGVELACETVQLTIGEGEPGQSREVGNLVPGNL